MAHPIQLLELIATAAGISLQVIAVDDDIPSPRDDPVVAPHSDDELEREAAERPSFLQRVKQRLGFE